ncbi:MAG TPA: hypothetical protein VLB04_11735 [Methanotrichaceae archaeon]|nr:hypothetical protein [Methanotrichaceae archaeon]
MPSLAVVGETVQLTVMLTYKGDNMAQAIVKPRLPSGVMTDIPEGRAAENYNLDLLSPSDILSEQYRMGHTQSSLG